MTNLLVAVLVPAHAGIDTIGTDLASPMRFLMPAVCDRYRLGGEFTGAWDRDYDPHTDPANWRPCTACPATVRTAGQPCGECGTAEQFGRVPGTVLVDADDWKAHAGDIVPLPRLLRDDWAFPLGRGVADTADSRPRAATPDVFADQRGAVWLSGSPTGEPPAELRAVWRSLLTGNRPAGAGGQPFDPSQWSIAVVAGHHTPEQVKATLPVVGSVVLITDPDWAEDDADPDQLYVVSEDVDAPYYQLVRIGGYGPNVPGYAITEIDPDRLTLAPAPDGVPPYRDILSRRLVTGEHAPDTSTRSTNTAPRA